MLKFIMCFLERQGRINENNKSIVELGIKRLIGYIEDFVFCFLLGTYFGIMIPSIIFQFSFIILRSYAGGYHTDSPRKCRIVSTAVTIICIYFIGIDIFSGMFYLIFSFLCWGGIIKTAPVQSKNRPLNQNEIRIFKARTMFVASFILFGCIVSCCFNLFILRALAVALLVVYIGLELVLLPKQVENCKAVLYKGQIIRVQDDVQL